MERGVDAGICERCLEVVGSARGRWVEVGWLIPSGEFHR